MAALNHPVLVGAPFQVVALDGRDLNAPDLLGPTRVPLGMGQRADLVFTMPAEGSVQLIDTEARATADVNASIVLGKHRGMRDGRPELIHTSNSEASPNVPPITVSQGQLVHLHIVKTTEEYHPMHLHGHVLSVLARNGEAIEASPVHLDSVLVGPGETWDVAFAADNPGIWMFHCHVLLHARMGMMTTINYTGVSTPFAMGSLTGNMPE